MASRNSRKPPPRRPTQNRRPNPPSRTTAPRKGPATLANQDSALRTAVAERSRGPIVWLSHQPQFVMPVVILVLIIVGLYAPVVVAAVALVVVLTFICWLAYLSWPVLSGGQRLIRILMVVVITATLVARVAGWL